MLTPRVRLAAALSVSVLTIVLVACGGGAGDVPASASASTVTSGDVPEGWTRAEIAAEGFSIGVPDGWQEMSAEDIGESGAVGAMASANPQVADTLAQAQAMLDSGQIAFFAVDTQPDDPAIGFAANVNVILGGEAPGTAADAEAAADEMAAAIAAQVPVSGDVTTETATLPAGEAGIVRYEWSITGADGAPIDVAVTQYAILADGRSFVLTFSAPAAAAGDYDEVFAQIAESFETE